MIACQRDFRLGLEVDCIQDLGLGAALPINEETARRRDLLGLCSVGQLARLPLDTECFFWAFQSNALGVYGVFDR